jgi:hypothetical protein
MSSRLSLVAVSLLTAFVLVACSDGSTEPETTTTAAASTTTGITTTTQAPPSTAATTTTEPSLAAALEGLAAAKGAVSTTTTEYLPAVPMTLTFDGEGCTFDGPTELTPGPVKYTFVNESKAPAVQNFVEVLEGKTLEDMIVHNGPEPFTGHHPSWTRELGTWWTTEAGDSKSWRKHLEPGNYFMVCGQAQPFLLWNGPWLTVAE